MAHTVRRWLPFAARLCVLPCARCCVMRATDRMLRTVGESDGVGRASHSARRTLPFCAWLFGRLVSPAGWISLSSVPPQHTWAVPHHRTTAAPAPAAPTAPPPRPRPGPPPLPPARLDAAPQMTQHGPGADEAAARGGAPLPRAPSRTASASAPRASPTAAAAAAGGTGRRGRLGDVFDAVDTNCDGRLSRAGGRLASYGRSFPRGP
jgi:hypothetical protein